MTRYNAQHTAAVINNAYSRFVDDLFRFATDSQAQYREDLRPGEPMPYFKPCEIVTDNFRAKANDSAQLNKEIALEAVKEAEEQLAFDIVEAIPDIVKDAVANARERANVSEAELQSIAKVAAPLNLQTALALNSIAYANDLEGAYEPAVNPVEITKHLQWLDGFIRRYFANGMRIDSTPETAKAMFAATVAKELGA